MSDRYGTGVTRSRKSPLEGHPIQVVSRRTGLSAEVLRIWEKRYAVVEPRRSPTGRRLYSEEDIERLRLLRQATSGGRRIGEVSDLGIDELRAIIQDDLRATEGSGPETAGHEVPMTTVEDCLDAVKDLDGPRLARILDRALLAHGGEAFLDGLAAPFCERLGVEWERGALDPHHEHLATAVLKGVLDRLIRQAPGDRAPTVVVATPASEHHEMGAMIVAASAAISGWDVVYLGADLPAEDISRAVARRQASVLALSIVHPEHEDRARKELRGLKRRIPPDVQVIAGGREATRFDKVLGDLGATVLSGTGDFRKALRGLSGSVA